MKKGLFLSIFAMFIISNVSGQIIVNSKAEFDQTLALAKQGDAWSQYVIGYEYLHDGEYHGPRDVDNARYWLKKAADQGLADAMYQLGNEYYYQSDYYEAVRWYRMAAEQGDDFAQYELGKCYYLGEGVSKNYNEATYWYRISADNGNCWAQYKLGLCYYEGCGVEQDYNKAYRLMELSAASKYGHDAREWLRAH